MFRDWRLLTLVAIGPFLAAVPVDAGAQSWRTVTVSRQTSGEEAVDVRVRFGAGRLTVQPGDPGTLYRMHLRYDEDSFEPVESYEGGHLDLGVDGTRHNFRWGKKDAQEMELFLARDVPMALNLEFGAVEADLDLGGLRMTRLDLHTGASESRVNFSQPNPVSMALATLEVGAADFEVRNLGNLNAQKVTVDAGVGHVVLDFQGEWQGNADVSVDMGLGALELRFPEGLGVKLMKDTFLTSLDSEGLVKRGDAFYSVDWDDARYRVTLTVDAALGSIDVVWVR